MVKVVKESKTWAGKFLDQRKDLRELREKDWFKFLKVFGEDSKAVVPLPSYKKEDVNEDGERKHTAAKVHNKTKVPEKV